MPPISPASAIPASRLVRECTATTIPSAASRLAVASPMPETDPVTNATLRTGQP
ncbi:hypothetical protein Aut01nite_47370 [Actinoplanes utahensis]|nr:hypothetical protein Aut01nite_47370 [Actinoplanes utahensis]